MLVFRNAAQVRRSAELLAELDEVLARIRTARWHDDVIELLIAAGELEAGALDAEQPEVDRPGAAREALGALSLAAGRLAVRSWRGGTLEDALGECERALRRIRPGLLPDVVRVAVPEGYAWYGVHPECWWAAAREALAQRDVRQLVVVGLRSIGTSLSAMAAAAADEATCVLRLAIRPRGHPWDRRPKLSPELETLLRAHADALFLVVDEGPGLSGTSLVGTALWLEAIGVPDRRIVLLPAHLPDPSRFVSETARAHWHRLRKHVVTPDALALGPAEVTGGDDVRDWSGGRWRGELFRETRAWPAVQPQHERLKWRAGDVVVRFVGLGRSGRAVRARIERMHAAGLGPAYLGGGGGYARLAFLEGDVEGPVDAFFVNACVRYLDWLRKEGTGRAAPFEPLAEMIEINLREALGACPVRLERFREVVADGEVVRIDGRMQRHEWVRTASGWLKVDGFDHHADHFYPGEQDVTWDLAGLAAEHGCSLRDEVMQRLGWKVPAARLLFHDLAYAAARLGYAHMAAGSVADPSEQARWRREAARYDRLAREALGRVR